MGHSRSSAPWRTGGTPTALVTVRIRLLSSGSPLSAKRTVAERLADSRLLLCFPELVDVEVLAAEDGPQAYVTAIHPLHQWTRCEKCKKEFREEDGWRVLMPADTFFYVCKECIPEPIKAAEFFEEKENESKTGGPDRPGEAEVPAQQEMYE